MDADVIIVGAGLAGLRCAIECQKKDLDTLVVEAGHDVGGRVRTEKLNGFLLDQGFQVLLTAYDECQNILDYSALDLGIFEPGAIVWTGKTFEKIFDPWRRPSRLFQSALSPIGSIKDKLKVARLRNRLGRTSVDAIQKQKEISTLQHLRTLNFSNDFIKRFFLPFYGGIFLEPNLDTTQTMFEFVFKMFGQGHAALPNCGMQSIPKQMAAQLKAGTIRLNQQVVKAENSQIHLADGSTLKARQLVVATDMSNAAKLAPASSKARTWNAAYCYYFSAPQSPLPEPMIALNGSGAGAITNIAVPSDISSGYSDGTGSLISVSTSKDVNLTDLTSELHNWFGKQAQSFKFLKSFTIPQALPRQLPGDNPYGHKPTKSKQGVWFCGDYRYSSSIQVALASGRMVGESISQIL
jgi:hypothetical protein